MAGDWIDTTLGEIVELKRGYDLPKQERRPGTVPVVSSSGISDFHAEKMVKGPGVVTGRYGTLGEVFYLQQDFWPLNTALYVCDFKGNDPRFISYLLRGLDFLAYSDKAAVPGLNRNHLHQAAVRIPSDVDEQRAIARILGTLDDKIELNMRMSETFEMMAQALFKSWFVDFDPVRAKARGRATHLPKLIADLFPSQLVDTEFGEAPEGWRIGRFGETVQVRRDLENPAKSPSTSFQHFSIPAFDKGQWPSMEHGDSIKSMKLRVPAGVVLLSKLNPEIERVWFVDVKKNDRAICSTEFLILQPLPPAGRAFVYCFARSPSFRQELVALSTGTSKSHQRAQADSILDLSMVRPPAALVIAFERVAGAFLQRTLHYHLASRNLTALRDTLLPKLISGELHLRDSERFIGKVINSGAGYE